MKFYKSQDDEKNLSAARDKLFQSGIDRSLYFHVGYFMTFYAAVEIRLTYYLARATNVRDLEAFELLTYGLDAKAKIERFKKAAIGRIGPNLTARLNIFYDHLIKMRNRITHMYAVPNDNHSTLGFCSLNQFPSFSSDRPPKSKIAFQVTMLEFFEHAVWLNLFNNDLKQVRDALKARGIFEIDHPQSPPLPAQNQSAPQKDIPATLGRRERKRIRKGQSPRGKRKPAE